MCIFETEIETETRKMVKTESLADGQIENLSSIQSLKSTLIGFVIVPVMCIPLFLLKNSLSAAKLILEFEEVKIELFKINLSSAQHDELRFFMIHSKLKTDENDRSYLLHFTPRDLCKEFQDNAN